MTIRNLINYTINIQRNDYFYTVWFDLYEGRDYTFSITKYYTLNVYGKYEIEVIRGLKSIRKRYIRDNS